MRRILVMGVGAIGNTLMQAPMLQRLSEAWPDAEIRFGFKADRGGRAVAEQFLGGRRAYVFSWSSGLAKGLGEVWAAALWRPQLILSPFLTAGRAVDIVAALSGARVIRHDQKSGLGHVALAANRHEVLSYLDLVTSATGRPVPPPPFAALPALTPPTETEGGVQVIALQPLSSADQAWKRWPAENWRTLTAALLAGGRRVLAFGSADEKDALAAMFADLPAVEIVCAPFAEATQRLGLCQGAICNDRALAHLAAALCVPVVTLFGPTDEQRTRPWTNLQAVASTTHSCRPCYRLDENGRTSDAPQLCTDRICLSGLTPALIISLLDDLLKPPPQAAHTDTA